MAPRRHPAWTWLGLPALTLGVAIALVFIAPTARGFKLSVLLNATMQLDPLVAMNLLHLAPGDYNCGNTLPPNATAKPINGIWNSTCDANKINMTSLNITRLDAKAVHSIPNNISNLFTLTQLRMSNLDLRSTIPDTLGFMGFMLDLDLSLNNLTGSMPATLCILTNLTSLNLHNNRLTGPVNSALGDIHSLARLDLGQNMFNGTILAALSSLASLTYLDISGYKVFPLRQRNRGRVMAISSPTDIPRDRYTFSDNLSVLNSSLQSLSLLKYMNLSNTAISGNLSLIPKDTWSGLSSLSTLDLTNTNVVGPFPDVMFTSMPNLCNVHANLSLLCPNLSAESRIQFNTSTGNNTCMCNLCNGTCIITPPDNSLPLPAIIGIVIGSAVALMAVLIGAYFFLRARRFNDGVEVHGVRRFSVPELEEATQGWEEQLGRGGFGEVYKGVVLDEDGSEREVAVKRTKAERRRNMRKFDSGFRNEILVLSGVRHRNLVELVGYSSKGADVLLVYDFIAQGSLDDLLKKELNEEGEGVTDLTWERRIKIAFGAAQGLDYLHSGVIPPIIHRDIKTSNILVDGEFVAKVADFGLSKIRPEMEGDANKTVGIQGTMGYIDPEYAETLKPTALSDVYSFGVVLLELATGWRPIGGPEKKHITQRVAKTVNSQGFDSIIAPSIRKELEAAEHHQNGGAGATTTVIYGGDDEGPDGQASSARQEITVAAYSADLFQRFVKLAMQCCAKDSSTRPSMRLVAKALGEMIEGKLEDPADGIFEERFDEDGGEQVVLLTHNLGGEIGATVAFVMESQAGPR